MFQATFKGSSWQKGGALWPNFTGVLQHNRTLSAGTETVHMLKLKPLVKNFVGLRVLVCAQCPGALRALIVSVMLNRE